MQHRLTEVFQRSLTRTPATVQQQNLEDQVVVLS